MIIGTGIDIVEVENLGKRLSRTSFDKVFAEDERAYAESKPKDSTQILAARWAAKEAFVKALGTGIQPAWPLKNIEVLHDDSGRPMFLLAEKVQKLLPEGSRVHLSMTHSREYAAAVVIIEKP